MDTQSKNRSDRGNQNIPVKEKINESAEIPMEQDGHGRKQEKKTFQ